MKETVFLIMGVLLSLSCAVSGRFFLRAGRREEYGKAFLLKGLTGLCFVVLGALNFVLCTDRIFGVRVLCGLCLGLLGDQLLALRFVYREKHDQFFSLGAAVFAVGHGLYLAALFGHDKGVLPAALPFLAAGLLASWLYQRAKKTDAGNLQLPACLYIALVVFMGSVACGDPKLQCDAAAVRRGRNMLFRQRQSALRLLLRLGPEQRRRQGRACELLRRPAFYRLESPVPLSTPINKNRCENARFSQRFCLFSFSRQDVSRSRAQARKRRRFPPAMRLHPGSSARF